MMEQLKELTIWLKQNKFTKQKSIYDHQAGLVVLFSGTAAHNKLNAAKFLGKEFNRKVHHVDLAKVISKYIGETEKNLERIFAKAKTKDWILFIDEADALFGKRTDVKDTHDRYANLEVSYLLQRLEAFQGLIILASNYKASLDPAFTRRFRHVVRFTKSTS